MHFFQQVCRDLDNEIADAKKKDEKQQKRKALADRQEQANRAGHAAKGMDIPSRGRISIHNDKGLSTGRRSSFFSYNLKE